MKVCTFFGHRNTPMEVEEKLKMRIEQIITEGKADTFLIGNNGNFDALAEKVLKELSKRFSDIKYSVVLAYIPREKKFWDTRDYSKTVYPKCLEGVPQKYAISKRNEWMLKEADIVICDILKEEKDKNIYFNNYWNIKKEANKNYMTSHMGPVARLYKTSLFRDNNIYFKEGVIYEDLAAVPLLGMYTKNIKYVNKAFYHYVIRRGSSMKQIKYNKSFTPNSK